MKFTISDCISRINQALNYPAISYEDVSHFFDQAISELNTSLRVSIPTVTEMRDEHTYDITKHPDAVVIQEPAVSGIQSVSEIPQSAPGASDPKIVYHNSGPVLDRRLYVFSGSWKSYNKLYGIVSGKDYAFESIIVHYDYAVWRKIPIEYLREFSLTEYLPIDWINLFLIPYVCFKFAVRNGDSGALFSDEFTQGFQQLQTSYNVPNEVTLSTVAHLSAYTDIVKDNLANLDVKVSTRAITEDMKALNGIRKVYGVSVYDSGGWGI